MLLRGTVAEDGDVRHGRELATADDEDVEIGERSHGGVPRPGVHGGEFPEEVAGAEGIDPTALRGDRHGPRENEEDSRPIRPSRASTSPRPTWTRSARRATSSSWDLVHSRN